MSKIRGTYLVTFFDQSQIVCGNNYKSWITHAYEFARWKYQESNDWPNQIVDSVQFSDTPFVDDGGLKYASPEAYQEIIDEMTAKDGKLRTNYADIAWSYSNADTKKLAAEVRA